MNEIDQYCVGQILEHAGDVQQIIWYSPQRDAQYHVVPTGTVQTSDGRYRRDYTATAAIGGKQTHGRTCWQPDGSWKIVRS